MPWIMLGIAGLFEIVWAIGLKYSDGLSQFWPAVGTITAMVISITLLAIAMKSLPVGTAYAVWTGIGAVGTVTVGILLLGEAVTPARLLCIGLIIMGIIGLKLSSP